MITLILLGAVVIALWITLFIVARKWARGRKSEPRKIPKEWLLSIVIFAACTQNLLSLFL